MKIKIKNKVIAFLVFLIFTTVALGQMRDNVVISKDIDFEIEIGTAIDLDLDPVYIDFGNLVRDNKDTITRTSYLKFKSVFQEDNLVTTSFPEEEVGDTGNNLIDPNYAKFDLEYMLTPRDKEKQQGKVEDMKTKLPVYIQRIQGMTAKKGDIQIPITAEIRGVPKDQMLGRYYKAIKMNVETTPKNPIGAIRTSGQGGMR